MMKRTGMYSVLLTGLLWSAPLWAAGAEGQSSMLDFFWKVVNTVILLAILYYFARKPISSALGKSAEEAKATICLLYTSPSPRDRTRWRKPSSA